MIEKLLSLIENEQIQPPASPVAIGAEAAALQAQFHACLPQDYRAFLEQMNGLDLNSLVLYGAGQSSESPGPGGFWQGIVAANRMWREGPGVEHYLVLGETSMDLLTVDINGTRPVLRDKVSSDINEEFSSVDDAVRQLINRYG